MYFEKALHGCDCTCCRIVCAQSLYLGSKTAVKQAAAVDEHISEARSRETWMYRKMQGIFYFLANVRENVELTKEQLLTLSWVFCGTKL